VGTSRFVRSEKIAPVMVIVWHGSISVSLNQEIPWRLKLVFGEGVRDSYFREVDVDYLNRENKDCASLD